ncbi:hypothetical protein BC938DRAFT_474453, partial [Jimgerdemannia flammicorona]
CEDIVKTTIITQTVANATCKGLLTLPALAKCEDILTLPALAKCEDILTLPALAKCEDILTLPAPAKCEDIVKTTIITQTVANATCKGLLTLPALAKCEDILTLPALAKCEDIIRTTIITQTLTLPALAKCEDILTLPALAKCEDIIRTTQRRGSAGKEPCMEYLHNIVFGFPEMTETFEIRFQRRKRIVRHGIWIDLLIRRHPTRKSRKHRLVAWMRQQDNNSSSRMNKVPGKFNFFWILLDSIFMVANEVMDEWDGWMDGMDGWMGWMDGMDGWDGWMGWMGWMDGMDGWDGWDGWMGWMDGMDGSYDDKQSIVKKWIAVT